MISSTAASNSLINMPGTSEERRSLGLGTRVIKETARQLKNFSFGAIVGAFVITPIQCPC